MRVCMTLTDTVITQHVGLYEANRQTLESAMTQDLGLYDANRQKGEVTTQQSDGPPEPSVVSPVPACSRGYHSATGDISQKRTRGHELLWLPPSRSRTSYLTLFAKMIMMPSILIMTMT